jgi:hypothetical protein
MGGLTLYNGLGFFIVSPRPGDLPRVWYLQPGVTATFYLLSAPLDAGRRRPPLARLHRSQLPAGMAPLPGEVHGLRAGLARTTSSLQR